MPPDVQPLRDRMKQQHDDYESPYSEFTANLQ